MAKDQKPPSFKDDAEAKKSLADALVTPERLV